MLKLRYLLAHGVTLTEKVSTVSLLLSSVVIYFFNSSFWKQTHIPISAEAFFGCYQQGLVQEELYEDKNLIESPKCCHAEVWPEWLVAHHTGCHLAGVLVYLEPASANQPQNPHFCCDSREKGVLQRKGRGSVAASQLALHMPAPRLEPWHPKPWSWSDLRPSLLPDPLLISPRLLLFPVLVSPRASGTDGTLCTSSSHMHSFSQVIVSSKVVKCVGSIFFVISKSEKRLTVQGEILNSTTCY